MNNLIKTLVVLLFVSFYSSSYAEDLEEQINKACLRHAVSLVTQLKTDVIKDLDKSQSDQALKIATDSCQAYFNKEFSNTTISNSESTTEAESSESKSSSILDVFDSEVIRKPGNERLKKKRY
jgi:hypothetical protein